jgi:hypothetical protein
MSPEVSTQPIFDLPHRQDSVLPYYQPVSGTSSVLPRYMPLGESTEGEQMSPLVLAAWAAVALAAIFMFVSVTKPSR